MPTPLPVIAGTYRCALNWVIGSETAVNVIHLHTAATPPTPAAVFELLQDTVTAGMWVPTVNGAVIGDISITPLDGSSATQDFATGGGAQWLGGTTGENIPQVAALIKFTTALRGRNNRGRIFLPAVGEGAQLDGHLTGGIDGTVTTAWTTFLTALTTDPDTPMNLVVASYDRAHNGAGAHATNVLNTLCEYHTATQRRRQTRLRQP